MKFSVYLLLISLASGHKLMITKSWDKEHPHPGYPADYSGSAGGELGAYQRKIPDNFDGPGSGDDQFMHSMIKDFAVEEATPEGKPTGKFYMGKREALDGAHRILKEHMNLEGGPALDHLDENFAKTWDHFNTGGDGKLEVSRMGGFYRYLCGNSMIPLFGE